MLEPTRMNNTIDVILCTEHLLYTNISILPPFADSDHVSLSFEVFADLWEVQIGHKNGAITLLMETMSHSMHTSMTQIRLTFFKIHPP